MARMATAMVSQEATEMASGLDPVDLTDPANFGDGPPHAFFARLRAQAPVWWHPDGLRRSGFWVVTRYEDVRSILLSPTVFVNAKGITIEPGEPAGLGDSEAERGQGAFSYTDPPEHGPLRKVLAQHFTPARIRALGPLVRAHADQLVSSFVAAGGGDFVTEVVDPYPLRVLAAVLGLPGETEAALRRFVAALGGSAVDDATRTAATIEFLTAVHELATARAAEPGPDLISAMVTGTSEGAGLAAERIGGILIQFAIAGNETTHGAAGLGLQLLLEHPDQFARLVSDPELIPGAVEEMLRFRPPVQYTRRTAAADAPLSLRANALTAAAGDTIYLSIASANRDPDVFADADTFDIGRASGSRSQLSLGVGAHFCLGAALARIELGSLFGAVAAIAPGMRSAGPARPGHSNQFIHSLAGLPVVV
jgi:cholest-4-en-3-one 26-monooxygenase